MPNNDSLTPKEIAAELDRHIVGQSDAKRAVAIALRNRWRRMQLDPELRDEVSPKNILMIGPTGVGKTEIARRLAKLANAPLIKVEATKFTEVGYVGRVRRALFVRKPARSGATQLGDSREQPGTAPRRRCARPACGVQRGLLREPRGRRRRRAPGLRRLCEESDGEYVGSQARALFD